MRELIILELRKVAMCRSMLIKIIGLIAVSILLAVAVLSFETYYYIDDNGHESAMSGWDALLKKRELYQGIEGELTTDMVSDALQMNNELTSKYGPLKNIPLPIYYSEIYPVEPVLKAMRQAFIDPNTGIALPFDSWTMDEAQDFYTQRTEILREYLTIKYPDHPANITQALQMNSGIDQFTYIYGFGSNALDYLSLFILLIVVICTITVSPIYSGDYQSGADDILRCTKRGRTKLGIAKLLASYILSLGVFIICISLYLAITLTIFGVDSLKTSLQMVFTAISFWPINMGEATVLVVLSGLLSLMAMVSFTALLSSRFKNPTSTLAAAMGMCFLPFILYVAAGGTVVDWIRLILPSGGIGFQNSFLYELFNTNLITLGELGVWSPYINPIACAIETFVFGLLSIAIYSRHEAL